MMLSVRSPVHLMWQVFWGTIVVPVYADASFVTQFIRLCCHRRLYLRSQPRSAWTILKGVMVGIRVSEAVRDRWISMCLSWAWKLTQSFRKGLG